MMRKSSILFLVVIFLFFLSGCKIVVIQKTNPIEQNTTLTTTSTKTESITLKNSVYKIEFEVLKTKAKELLISVPEKKRPFICSIKKVNNYGEVHYYFNKPSFESLVDNSSEKWFLLRGYSKDDVEKILENKKSEYSNFGYSLKKLKNWGDFGYLEIEIWNE